MRNFDTHDGHYGKMTSNELLMNAAPRLEWIARWVRGNHPIPAYAAAAELSHYLSTLRNRRHRLGGVAIEPQLSLPEHVAGPLERTAAAMRRGDYVAAADACTDLVLALRDDAEAVAGPMSDVAEPHQPMLPELEEMRRRDEDSEAPPPRRRREPATPPPEP